MNMDFNELLKMLEKLENIAQKYLDREGREDLTDAINTIDATVRTIEAKK